MNAYHRFPVWMQHLAVTLHGVYWRGLTRGPGYRAACRAFRARNPWRSDQWAEWTAERLKAILTRAVDSVPYYRDTWTLADKSAARMGHLTALPLLERHAVQADPWAFVTRDSGGSSLFRQLRARFRYTRGFRTSGSTGTPIVTVWTRREILRAQALREVRAAEPVGVSYAMRRAVMNGRAIFRPDRPDDAVWRYDAAGRRLHLSPFHLRPDTVHQYVAALERYRPVWILGYAVSLGILARLIRAQGLRVPPVRAVITISEPLLAWARADLEAVFQCRVYEEYGMVENVAYAVACEQGNLHVSPDAGVIEILRADGTPCDPGEPGEIVATGLLRMHQPLIRYRTGDRAAWVPAPCSCDRGTPALLSVDGRLEDILEGPDGRQVSRIHVIFVHQPRILEAQVIQEAVDRVRVRVVPGAGFADEDAAAIGRDVRRIMGPTVGVVVERVPRIARTRAGKFMATIQKHRP